MVQLEPPVEATRPSARHAARRALDAARESVRGYGAGEEEMPLGAYAALLGLYQVALAAYLGLALRREADLPARVPVGDLLLTGVATHKLTRIVTRDWVTAPLRAPFTEYQGSAGAGEVNERSRGRGLRRGVGDLLTCPFCTGPWVALGFGVGWLLAPRATRAVASIFAATALSDGLHLAYGAARRD